MSQRRRENLTAGFLIGCVIAVVAFAILLTWTLTQ
jgi:tetrahydromethanopterin S-methyltransferase subunit F